MPTGGNMSSISHSNMIESVIFLINLDWWSFRFVLLHAYSHLSHILTAYKRKRTQSRIIPYRTLTHQACWNLYLMHIVKRDHPWKRTYPLLRPFPLRETLGFPPPVWVLPVIEPAWFFLLPIWFTTHRSLCTNGNAHTFLLRQQRADVQEKMSIEQLA